MGKRFLVNGRTTAQVRLENIGFCISGIPALPQLSALENVMLPLRLQPDFNFRQAEQKRWHGWNELGWFVRHSKPRKFCQVSSNVAIARALIAEPKIILLMNRQAIWMDKLPRS